jgi:two-component system cell cycle response regulator DivK
MSYILLVEDSQENADLVIRVLQAAKFEVRHTLRGLDGAQMARKDRPSLILMDFNLPDIDGRTLALQLKKNLGGNAAPPIVALTARAGANEEKLAKKFGCTDFVSKPFVPEELLKLVQRLVETSDTPIPKKP